MNKRLTKTNEVNEFGKVLFEEEITRVKTINVSVQEKVELRQLYTDKILELQSKVQEITQDITLMNALDRNIDK